MKKAVALLLALLITASLLQGCEPSETGFDELKEYRIQLAFYQYWEEYFSNLVVYVETYWTPWFHQGYGYGIHYLGSDGQFDFVYYEAGASGYSELDHIIGEPITESYWIGNTEFCGVTNRGLWAYKDGNLYLVNDLYEKGCIRDSMVILLQARYAQAREAQDEVSSDEQLQGYGKWVREGYYENYVPEWMQEETEPSTKGTASAR